VPELVVSEVSQGLSRGRSKRWVQVLSGVSFEVERGEVVGIVGGRLSGKTTLLRIAAGLSVPEEGSVTLGERDLTSLPERKREELRGRDLVWINRAGMSQKLEVSKIVGWHLAKELGRRGAERRAEQMLKRVGAAHCAHQRWDDLSRWEQVLVGLARVFAGEPRIIVIDDLLDVLGTPWTEEASDLLRSLIEDNRNRCGVVMSASDRDSVVLVNRVWLLENAKLIPTSGHRESEADILPFRQRDAEP
jgi:ABC-type lipoprotein export system ATPase subunit